MSIEVTAEWIAKIESYLRDDPHYAPSRLSTLALIAKLHEAEALARNSEGDLYQDLWKASSANVGRVAKRANELRAERDALTAKLEDATEALKDALSSLTAANSLLSRSSKKAAPSDKMFDQMLADYKASEERSRAALSRLTAEPAKVEQPGEWRTLVAPSRPTQALFAKLREAEAERSALTAKLEEAKAALLHAREFVDEEMELRACAGGDESVREYAEAPRVTLAKIDAALSRLTAEPAKGGEA